MEVFGKMDQIIIQDVRINVILNYLLMIFFPKIFDY